MSILVSKLQKSEKLFKLVLGLGNLNLAQIEFLTKVYLHTKIDIFDLPASQQVIDLVYKTLQTQNIKKENFIYSLSFALDGDKHGKKAFINNNKCKKCFKCIKKCPQKAILIQKDGVFVDKNKCIGCQKCAFCKAISFQNEENISIENVLNLARNNKLDIVEMHCSIKKTRKIKEAFMQLNEQFHGPISVCFNTDFLSKEKLIKLCDFFIKKRNSKSLIIQADGNAMSGSENDFGSTLQAVSCAQLFEKRPIYLFISGGTNEKTPSLLKMCNIRYDCIAVGSYARKIVENVSFEKAVQNAQKLVNICKN